MSEGPRGVIPNPLVDVLVRVLVADGLRAQRTGPDRLEVGRRAPTMEWCCVGDMLFGRAMEDLGERAWMHTVSGALTAAPAEVGRGISTIVRRLDRVASAVA